MSDRSELGNRMKAYERVSEGNLMKKTPVILRVDGKAFHTFARKMRKPIDASLEACMLQTAVKLCEGIDGAKLAYVQSDEISVLVTDWASLGTQAYFDYRIQKTASVVASMATAVFNSEKDARDFEVDGKTVTGGYFPSALFDCRAFNVPMHEVANYFIWRQQDATRNSVSSLAQANFSHKRLQNLNCGAMQELLFTEKGINWNDCPTGHKRGYCVTRKVYQDREITNVAGWLGRKERGILAPVTRHKWEVDNDIPVFTQDRDYIQALLEEGTL